MRSLIVVSSEQCVLSLIYSLSPVLLAINLPVLSRSFPHVIRQTPRVLFQLLQAALFLRPPRLGSPYTTPYDSIFEISLLYIGLVQLPCRSSRFLRY